MQPQDPFNQVPSGIDYLNQIAAPPPAKGFDKKTIIIAIVLGVVALLSIFIILAGTGNKDKGPSLTTILARLQKLQTVSEKYKPRLKATTIRDTNTSLISVLGTAQKNMEGPAASSGIDLKKQAKEIAAMDSSTEITTKLDNAVLNSNLDETYTYVMNTELADTILIIERLHKSTRDAKLQEVLAKIHADLTNIRKQLEKS